MRWHEVLTYGASLLSPSTLQPSPLLCTASTHDTSSRVPPPPMTTTRPRHYLSAKTAHAWDVCLGPLARFSRCSVGCCCGALSRTCAHVECAYQHSTDLHSPLMPPRLARGTSPLPFAVFNLSHDRAVEFAANATFSLDAHALLLQILLGCGIGQPCQRQACLIKMLCRRSRCSAQRRPPVTRPPAADLLPPAAGGHGAPLPLHRGFPVRSRRGARPRARVRPHLLLELDRPGLAHPIRAQRHGPQRVRRRAHAVAVQQPLHGRARARQRLPARGRLRKGHLRVVPVRAPPRPPPLCPLPPRDWPGFSALFRPHSYINLDIWSPV